MGNSCMKCSRYVLCNDKRKAKDYSCNRYEAMRAFSSLDDVFNADFVPQGEENPDIQLSKLVAKAKPTILLPGTHEFNKAERDNIRSAPEEQRVLLKDENEVESNFIYEAMQAAYDPLTNSVRDVKIDDRDIPLAKNYLDFCTNIAGKSIKPPFARQLWVAAHLLAEYCPKCTSKKYNNIMEIPVDMDPNDAAKKIILLNNGVCPRCFTSRSELILSGRLTSYVDLAMIFGQRSGKSSFSSTLSADIFHRYLKAPRLSDICRGIQEFSPLTATFVGLTAARAIKLLWNPFSAIIENSTWFEGYFEMLRTYGRKYDREFYKRAGLYMRIFNKNLDLYPSAPLKRTLRGDTRFLACLDEGSWFPYKIIETDDDDGDDERERANANEVLAALTNSLTTVRTEVLQLYKQGINTIPTGLGLYMSSPVSEQDALCRMEAESHTEGSLTLGARLPTWEVNPFYTRNHPVIVAAYSKNAIKAERDFGANPPQLSSSLFTAHTLEGVFSNDQNTWRIVYMDHDTETRGKAIMVNQPDILYPSVVAIDAGLTNNAFSVVVAHRKGSKMKVTLVLELVPKPGKLIHYPTMYDQVILPISRACNVWGAGADRWNSINLLQQLEQDVPSCKAFQKMLTYRDITNMITSLAGGDIELPKLELPLDKISSVRDFKHELLQAPVSHLALQLMTVKDTGSAYMKGDGFTDDIFRALCMAHYLLFSNRLKEHLKKAKVKDLTLSQKSNKKVLISAGRSSMGALSRGGTRGRYDL